jgi:hypothetical protein
MTVEASPTYLDVPAQRVAADNAIDYAYRDQGQSDLPLVLLQHFRGNLDKLGPHPDRRLAADRRVITFDNTGVGAETTYAVRRLTVAVPASASSSAPTKRRYPTFL